MSWGGWKRGRGRAIWIAVAAAGVLSLYPALRAVWSQAATSSKVIPPRTAITIRLARPLTSQNAQLGEPFEARVVSSADVNGAAAIPPGTRVEGRCVAVRPAEGADRPGYLRLALSGLRDAQGRLARLETTTFSEWGGQAAEVGHAPSQVMPGEQFLNFSAPGSTLGRAKDAGAATITPQDDLTFLLLKPVVIPRWPGLPAFSKSSVEPTQPGEEHRR